MDIRLLEYFFAVAKAGSFSRAAEDISISQPGLSQAIAQLERSLGCRLFQRGRRIAMTVEGERLQAHCRKIFDLLEDARDDISRISSGVKGTVRPAILESILLFLLPEVISRFSGKFPKVNFRFSLLESRNIEKAVLENANHFGLTAHPPLSRVLEEVPLAEFPHVLFAPRAAKGGIESLMKKLPLFVLGDWQEETLRVSTDLFSNHPSIRVLNPINHVAMVRALVAKGLGLAVLPGFVEGPEIRAVRRFPDLRMTVYLIRNPRRNSFAASETFMEFLRREVGK